jgi:hypothetical protein
MSQPCASAAVGEGHDVSHVTVGVGDSGWVSGALIVSHNATGQLLVHHCAQLTWQCVALIKPCSSTDVRSLHMHCSPCMFLATDSKLSCCASAAMAAASCHLKRSWPANESGRPEKLPLVAHTGIVMGPQAAGAPRLPTAATAKTCVTVAPCSVMTQAHCLVAAALQPPARQRTAPRIAATAETAR